jgi:hypothetical protein
VKSREAAPWRSCHLDQPNEKRSVAVSKHSTYVWCITVSVHIARGRCRFSMIAVTNVAQGSFIYHLKPSLVGTLHSANDTPYADNMSPALFNNEYAYFTQRSTHKRSRVSCKIKPTSETCRKLQLLFDTCFRAWFGFRHFGDKQLWRRRSTLSVDKHAPYETSASVSYGLCTNHERWQEISE